MSKVLLTVDIEVKGEFPNRSELSLRKKIARELDRRKVGKLMGSGGGLGAMDLCYLVEDETTARQEIAVAVQQYLPHSPFTVEAEEFEGEALQVSLPRLIAFVLLSVAVLVVIGFLIWKRVIG